MHRDHCDVSDRISSFDDIWSATEGMKSNLHFSYLIPVWRSRCIPKECVRLTELRATTYEAEVGVIETIEECDNTTKQP